MAVRLDTETATVRGIEARVDTKAGTLMALTSGLLVAGLALLGAGKLPGPAALVGWIAAGLLGAAVVLLSAAVRPNLGGSHGFVRWAFAASGRDVLAALSVEQQSPSHIHLAGAEQLHWLSRSLHRKFARIRTAQTLLAAVLAALGR
ncbi:hypothetical protein BG844_09550 [Couchioplanes caeruleus subsp. caeruleus]|uniref:Pycsar effector protein domain-containing protein n=1 Tax=Couchioplanes caeruleus subsp. caeruleus TaxID=56427 RepID=A0A1K0FNS9_9ACTN|nr:hypothetical protein BG844_09550 [Couchioplanes caeruleus subsp. caeruleus]